MENLDTNTTKVIVSKFLTTKTVESGAVLIYLDGKIIAEVSNTDTREIEVG